MSYRSDGATAKQRFDEKVAPADQNMACSLRVMRPAHRWLYEEAHGEWPRGTQIERIISRVSWRHILKDKHEDWLQYSFCK
jgi:hypothetical protein